ncbi:TraB/GumN family protein [Novosphingobium profundi]|uniref:TraB/GumN family protein n=1 Tax=Novosphingobium profundi TaxID=1774954 RepID=UPI001BD950FF|nr:TraB/GumN family protein [Novosphingobium profundi]MBT0669016.1 TraB/GumN family protein [Novosphingobium profundi]
MPPARATEPAPGLRRRAAPLWKIRPRHQGIARTWLRIAAACLAGAATLPAAPAWASPAQPETAGKVPARTPVVHPALWKVSDEDTTIWLFGTIHVLPEPVNWDTGAVAKALAASDTLVTEVPMDDNRAAQVTMARLSQRDDGKNLRDTLPPKVRTAYEEAMTSLGLPVGAFDANDGWFAALMLSLIPLQASGFDLANGIDKQITEAAIAQGKAREALETPEYQLGQFETLSPKTQAAYLAEVIEALPTMKSDIGDMVEAWKNGKAEKLAEILNEQESDPAIREALLTTRNANWTKWIEQRLATPGTVFMAVGAGHLAGKDSVQALLARDGVKAVRVQ